MAARDSFSGGSPRQIAVGMVNAWRGSLVGSEEEAQAVPERAARAMGIENVPGVEVEEVAGWEKGALPRRWRHSASGNISSRGV